MKIKITDKNGLVLKTAGKLCEDNIVVVPDESILGGGGGAIDLANVPEVESIDNPTETSPAMVRYQDQLYLLIKEN